MVIFAVAHQLAPAPTSAQPLMHPMSSLSSRASSSPSSDALSNSARGESPTLLERDQYGQFPLVCCFFCKRGQSGHRCTANVPDGNFCLNLKRICGRPFCHDCTLAWGIEDNSTRCIDHKDIGIDEIAPPMSSIPPSAHDMNHEPDTALFTSVSATANNSVLNGPNLADDPSSPSLSSTSVSLVPETDSTHIGDNRNTAEDPFASYAVGQIYEKNAFVSAV